MTESIRVLVVDDSPFRCEVLTAMLAGEPGIKVVGKAKDGIEAVEMAERLRPSVITMDFKMPRMDGPQAIKNIMAKTPTPIIMVSVTVENQKKFILKCLGLGALDFVPISYDTERMAEELIEKVRLASSVKVIRHVRAKAVVPMRPRRKQKVTARIVAIAVSTGGPQALEEMLPRLPDGFPAGIVIVQHMAEGFSREMAEWLDEKSRIRVREAHQGNRIEPGLALVAPGGRHLAVERGGRITLSKNPAELVNKPSADVMLESVARVYGQMALGVIMTGMGRDGVQGMREIKKAGGRTIAQDEKSSVVFGMNKAAIENGCIDRIVPLSRIPEDIMSMI